MFKQIVLTVVGCCFVVNMLSAQILTIEDCYKMARANYPAIQKMELIAKTAELNLSNANRVYLPQLNISGQATYQSETVGFGDVNTGAGISFPSVSKDQYKVVAEVTQLIYDGGKTHTQKELMKVTRALDEERLETNLHAINNRINSIFFRYY